MKNDFDHIITEINAGCVLVPKTEIDKAWNEACNRACRIVRLYCNGQGLFQQVNTKTTPDGK